MSKPVKMGVVGCGAISAAYLGMAKNFPIVEVAAVADLDLERAKAKAKDFNVPRVLTVDQLMKDPEIELVMNLTVPKAHLPIALQALENGKHTYAEKPFGIDREEGRKVLELAKKKGLKVGCAPDTFMGAGIQTARKLLEEGAIGKPVAFTAFMMCRGHESWHPSPEFYYEVGGGPMFDMGPYYLTALLNLFGPVRRISGSTSIAVPERTITHKNKDGTNGPKFGKKITVETPDHVCGLMEFANGCTGVIIQTFATYFAEQPGNRQPIVIYGTEGTMRVPDPNTFDNMVSIKKPGDADWIEQPHQFVKGYGRSIGAADMACAIRSGRPFRANGEQAFYVLDLMAGFQDSSSTGKHYTPTAPYAKPAPMRGDLPYGKLED